MTPAARLQAAMDILQGLEGSNEAADRFVRHWFSGRRYAGAKDRASVADRVHDVLRHRASYAWRMQSHTPRALVIASLASEGVPMEEAAALFGSSAYAPPELSVAERAQYVAPPREPMPAWVEGDYPEWLEPELARRFGDALGDEMKAMLARAAVDLRTNTLRANRDDMVTGLGGLGLAAVPTPFSPHGIRIPAGPGLGALQNSPFFQTGAVEIQDEASQIAALLCAARSDMRVLDLAAGAGGKSLALAAEMKNAGQIVAADRDEKRLAEILPRARRAGATNITSFISTEGRQPEGAFDVVLVDAPCSGSGTWRRNPGLKWQLKPDRLDVLTALQDELLETGAARVREGGRLIYATCSLLPRENEDRVEAFLMRHAEFSAVPACDVWRETMGENPVPPGMDNLFRASPLTTGTDGFFAAIFTRGG